DGHRRHGEDRRRRHQPAVAHGDRDERGDARPRHAALARVRLVVPGTLRHFLDAIKFEHTVFALPFAYVAMVLAAGGWPGWHVLGWVTLAMAGARTLAMSVKRPAHRLIDAAQPR